MSNDIVRTSKFLSKVLRHKPESIGLVLDAQGWADVDELLRLANQHGRDIPRSLLERVVAENDKKRFAFSEDQSRIRASQGHSIAIDLALESRQPPARLFHGTASRFLSSIHELGLHSGNRQHVHLSLDEATARTVGQRHGDPVVLTVLADAMFEAGHVFFVSANGVWLTERVPREYLEFPRHFP